MLVIGSDKLGQAECTPSRELCYPIPGIVVEVVGWKHKLYALYFLPETPRIQTQAVTGMINPSFTKRHVLEGEENESTMVIIAGHIFIVDRGKRHVWHDLRFKWINPNEPNRGQ